MHTKGKWEVKVVPKYLHELAISVPIHTPKGQMLLGCNGMPEKGEMLTNANLVVSAVNACTSINPNNPQAVAGSIEEMHEVLSELIQAIEDGYECIGSGRQADIERILDKAGRE